MLPAAQRLRRSSDFGAAVRAGRRAGRGPLVVHLASAATTQLGATWVETAQVEAVQPAAEGPVVARPEAMADMATTKPARSGVGAKIPPARAGFVVSRAIGNAVTRNRLRRRLRHLVRERLDQLPAGSTLVVRALPGAADVSYARLGAYLDAAIAAARAPRPRRGRSA